MSGTLLPFRPISLFCRRLAPPFRRRLLSSVAKESASESPVPVRVRFAPSPTGQLHLGGFRTALYNYMFARSHNGTFVLRIEDTDRSRFVPGAEDKLEKALAWMGVRPDESPSKSGPHGPYRQSERLHLYRECLQTLLDKGHAYHCFCSERRLELKKKEAARLRVSNRYDGRCRELTPAQVEEKLNAPEPVPHVIRFKIPDVLRSHHDLVHGDHTHDVYALEGDPVIVKSDGYPTYHFANVVDDHHMRISHVLRGSEWQVSTPKHLMLYDAFGWAPPLFAHLPLMTNSDGSKLSKRQGDVHLEAIKDKGYATEAILNYVTLFGGGFENRAHCTDKLYTLAELTDRFRLDRVNVNSCKVEPRCLNELNRAHLRARLARGGESAVELATELRTLLRSRSLAEDRDLDDQYLLRVLNWASDRIYKLDDLFKSDLDYLWTTPDPYRLADVRAASADLSVLDADTWQEVVGILDSDCGDADEVDSKKVSGHLRKLAKTKKVKFAALMKVLRLVLTGELEGAPVGEVLQLLGKDEAKRRLRLGIKLFS